MFGKEYIFAALEAISREIIEHQEELNHLDNAIGDGDHGTNMARFSQSILQELPDLAASKDDFGEIFHYMGMRCINGIGGSAGPLFGTFYLRAGMASQGKKSMEAADWVMAFNAGTIGVSQLGKSNEGDKTMVDAMFPAGRAMQAAVEEGRSFAEILLSGVEAAQNGVEYTKTIQASRGRASYIGMRSIGHQDPGATTILLMLQAMYKAAQKLNVE
ncbi:MAG: dihydroxyacetone kinase subunit L [Selenomonas sp.]|uniref:dihydroxyacetone kinase subunit DhaL n=1 Tax=Selenomonas sp. TaxID=2053611 RepID=UPI0025E26056|nr:dihydroxyacetone kinase subunit DhaL [Selenomonas sp.]MCR5756911.1 dihydroxyacetone kinase subunit L [Selenomonas sp.]